MPARRVQFLTMAGVAATLSISLAGSHSGAPPHSEPATVGMFSENTRPKESAVRDTRPTSVGVRFTTSRAGKVSAVKFFRSRQNRGRQKVKLWTAQGVLLGTGAYRGHGTGWVKARLRRPVPISAHTRYVASYFAPHGRYSRTRRADFPIRANSLSALRGLRGGGRAMPSRSSRDNYFVDVVFKPLSSPPTTGADDLQLPRVPWEGGPAYWSQFPKARQSGWDQPTFFPISVFLGKPEHASALRHLGINTYMGAEHDGTKLKYVTDRGIFVLAQQEEFTLAEVGNNPGVVGWLISDECEMGYSGCPEGPEEASLAKQVEYVNKVTAFADGRFKQANFGNGILRTFWAPTTMDDHVQLMDVASADKYAYTSPHVQELVPTSPDWPRGAEVGTAAAYGWQADQMKRFQDPRSLRPIWTFVETAMPLLDESGAHTITPDQLEGAVWSAIIHEARGVAFFQHNNNELCDTYSLLDCGAALRSKVTQVTTQIRDLASVINTQSYEYDFANGTDTMLKAAGGHAYIFAGIGLLESPGTKQFALPPGVSGTTVTVVGENRTIPVEGGRFTDTFAAEHTHHIYRIAL